MHLHTLSTNEMKEPPVDYYILPLKMIFPFSSHYNIWSKVLGPVRTTLYTVCYIQAGKKGK